ncbi:ABC-type transport auxiliary lipoprotein family protein [Thauera aromatica]|uniref:ABC-type transport auxiliary lipoprotein component n=1 Tax=Thauera aromatica K172 TaxID=44139 RepID=A0A2R4BNG4_THAAR|nr:ABC-type transport auxiliary lipoprotein family protein [Thauera aromatica]AVR88869.1 ABC-type transport auxiliary lipoprotein component [Thauera aromatica K172]
MISGRSPTASGLRGIVAALGIAAALAGCSGLNLKPPPMAFYDLGLGAPAGLAPRFAPLRVEVAAPPWLASSALQYRLQWDDPLRRRSYTESRWVAQPADMLALALERALKPDGSGNRCRLRIEVDEFVQVFDGIERSRVEVVLRAGLVPPRSDEALAQREFRADVPAPSADAVGGVAAFRAAADRLAGELAGWIATLHRAGPPLDAGMRCRG